MKHKTTMLAALLLTMALLLSACGTTSETAAMKTEAPAAIYDQSAGESMVEMPAEETAEVEVEDTIVTAAAASDALETAEMEQLSEKIIYSGYVSMETTEFDAALSALDQAVREFGGFVQDSNVAGTSDYDGQNVVVRNRWASYTVRIPTERFDEFLTMTDGIGNVTNSGRTAENVTSRYTDYEARLSSLTTQEERLLAMLEQSGDLESFIQLEERLSEVRYEIESIERNLRNLDQKLNYSTVTVDIQEVEIYTPAVTVQRSFGEKISDSFTKGWKRFGRSCQNFLIDLVGAMPTLLLLGLLAGVGVTVFVKVRSRKKAKAVRTEQQQVTQEGSDSTQI